MLIFTCSRDVNSLSSTHPAIHIIETYLSHIIDSNTSSTHKYNPTEDGYLVLIEKSDLRRTLTDIGISKKLVEIPFEGVTKIDDFYHAVYVPNNQFTLSFLIPDESWIPENLRKHLEDYLDEK